MRDGLFAGAAGALLSGAPSTLITAAGRGNVLDSTRAVGRVVLGPDADGLPVLAAGAAAHAVISLGWGVVLEHSVPRGHEIVGGALAGLAIAAVDLGLIGRRLPAIAGLPGGREVLDHLAFGAVAGAVLSRRRAPVPDRR